MAKTPHDIDVSEEAGVRYLHFGSDWVQGAMRVARPFALELDYTREMMLPLLLRDASWPRRILLIGLGAASLTKFCHKELRMVSTTVIELNPQVLAACHSWFKLPADNPGLQVVLADAAQEILKPVYWGTVDALQVDLYDHEAAAPVLDSLPFYNHCRRLLTDSGVMTVNLFGRASSFDRSVEKISAAFGKDAVWAFRPTREGNTVVLAQYTPSRPKRELLMARAAVIESRWGLPADKWVRVFKPVMS